MGDNSAAVQIDDIVKHVDDWRGQSLVRLRTLVTPVDPGITEAVKWTRPEGVSVRAIDCSESMAVDAAALQALVREAVELNASTARPPAA